MTGKTVPFRQPPSLTALVEKPAETWVDPSAPNTAAVMLPAAAILPAATSAPTVPTTRMTFDVRKSLHMGFKMQCLRRGRPDYEIGTAIIERAVAELEKE